MLNHLFDPTAAGGDWSFDYTVASGILDGDAWAVGDVVRVALSPEAISWDDYGRRSLAYPSADVSVYSFFSVSSDDAGGAVTLVAPKTVLVNIPANSMSLMGVGTVNVGLRLFLASGGNKVLLTGRLPIESSGGV